ncbi:MAG: ABC transporter permease [Candidatus Aminicenantes bacterium]|nr:ABC transporter permease [Candidatus Aminicenantes bacterium]
MKKILSVIKREYIQIVRTKGFIIGTILGPVFMGALIVVPVVLQFVSLDQQERIGIIDESHSIFMELDKALDQKIKDGTRRYLLTEYMLTGSVEELKQELNRKVLQKEIEAYIFIPKDISGEGEAEYVAEHVSDFDKRGHIGRALSSIVIGKRLRGEGLDPAKINEYMRPVRLATKKVTKRGVEKDTGGTFIISYFLVLILYMTLIFYGQIILRGVIEEKSSRVVEIVLSSLRPFQLMTGKIVGIAAVGFTQYAIWTVFGIAATRYSKDLITKAFPAAAAFEMPSIPSYIFIYFVVFFICGYFLYATIYAAIGSMVNSEKEAQNLVMPVTMFLVVPILMMMFVIRNPNSTFSVILSMIPFFTPILMLLRVCILLPPFIQIGVSILLLILTTLLMIWITAKIYRVGILMYGKRPGFAEILKWIRYS